MSTFFIAIWMGGIPRSYCYQRTLHKGAFRAAIGATFWPIDLGYWIAEHVYK